MSILINRRRFMQVTSAAVTGAAVSSPTFLWAQNTDAKTVRMVVGDLQIYDPIFSTSDSTQFHGYAIYDTLFSLDDDLVSQPQMVGEWSVSDDKKNYEFTLRDGLSWHDGTPVKAADCVASIKRWGQVDPSGILLLERSANIAARDEHSFTITTKEPFGLVADLLANAAGQACFIMREQDALRSAKEQVTANIGSGPFKFNAELTKPGARVVYDRNEAYVPRSEPASGYAGGKVVKVDRVTWENITDSQTAVAALTAGEVDLLLAPPADLYPVIEADPSLQLGPLSKSGSDFYARINFLQKPFSNIKARQALLHLVDQQAFQQIIAPDGKLGGSVKSLFGNETAYTNDENTGWYKEGGNSEKAKQLFQEAGYAGEKVLILAPTDWRESNSAAQLLANSLQKIGVNAVLAPMTWSELAARRANKGSVDDGGWSIFITNASDFSFSNPVGSSFFLANGEDAWFGWPKSDEFEALRAKWPDAATPEDRKKLARDMQAVWWDFVGAVFLCRSLRASAWRSNLKDVIATPAEWLVMWNMQKV